MSLVVSVLAPDLQESVRNFNGLGMFHSFAIIAR